MVKQCTILFGCLALGDFVVWATGVKLPGSIIGMLLLTAFLQMGWVKLRWVKAEFWPIFTATVVSTVLVLVVTGHVHQWVRRHGVFRK